MTYKFIFKGQIRGGKNHIQITKTGRRFPLKSWAEWCNREVASIDIQRLQYRLKETITQPCGILVEYESEDRRRRDSTAILDAIYHVMEKAGIVADDAQFEHVHFSDYGKTESPFPTTNVYITPTIWPDNLPPKNTTQ